MFQNLLRTLFITGLLFTSVDSQRVKFSQTLIDPAIEGKTYSINVVLDEPIICADMRDENGIDMGIENCRVTMIFDNPEPDMLSISPCYVTWENRDWATTKNFQIRMTGHFRNIADQYIKLISRPIISKSEYYTGFIPATISIKFRSLNTATCSSTGDPHYSTFDGYYFHFYGRGKSWLAYVPGELEVQTITHGAGYSRNCAIAVSEGGNYVMLSVCSGSGGIKPVTEFKDISSVPKIFAFSGTNYQVDYPSGLSVKFQTWGNNANVYLTLPGRYYKHSRLTGLCGNWNGIRTDEDIPAYVMWEWGNLNVRHQIVSGSEMDLFTGVSDSKIMRTYNNADHQFLLNVKTTCDYIPPVYIRPILNNPDIEDITELIKKLTIKTVDPNQNNFVIDVNITTVDDEVVDSVTDNMGPSLDELVNMCKEIIVRPELEMCDDIVMRHIDNCINDLNLVKTIMVVQESLESARTECLQSQIIKTTTDDQVNAIVNIICMANCPIYSKCVENKCVCVDTNMKGPMCTIPVNAIPEFNSISPSVVDIVHWKMQGAKQIMFTLATKYIMPSDNLECVLNGVYYPANYLSETVVVCQLPIVVNAIDDVMINMSVYLKVNNNLIATPRYIVSYYNLCVKCDPNGIMECDRRSDDICFPKGFKPFKLNVESIKLLEQTCDRPSVQCQYCEGDSVHIDWFTDKLCMPYFNNKYIYVRHIESGGIIQFAGLDLTSYINDMTDANNNLAIASPFDTLENMTYWRVRSESFNVSYKLDCDDMFTYCMFSPSVALNPITVSMNFVVYIDLYIGNTIIDTIEYNIMIINSRDNDPITTNSIASTKTMDMSNTNSQPTTSDTTTKPGTLTTKPGTLTTNPGTTTYINSATTTLVNTTTIPVTMTPTDTTTYVNPVTTITYTPFMPTETTTTTFFVNEEKPIVARGAMQKSASFPSYAIGIIGAFVIMIMIVIALISNAKYRRTRANQDKLDTQFILDYQTTSDKGLSFINPLFVKPAYMEPDMGLINPLYDALINMEEGTYKVINTANENEHILALRGVNGSVETYQLRMRDNKVVLNTIYDTNDGVIFDSIDNMVNHYTHALNTYPLSCNLKYVCPEDSYTHGNIYGYNNNNIKNTLVSDSPDIENGDC